MQVTLAAGTAPSDVAGSNLHAMVRTVFPSGWSTVIVALVKARSSMLSTQFLLGQSGAPSMDAGGGLVLTLKATFPFFTSDAGIVSLPVTVRGAGF